MEVRRRYHFGGRPDFSGELHFSECTRPFPPECVDTATTHPEWRRGRIRATLESRVRRRPLQGRADVCPWERCEIKTHRGF